MNVDFIISDQQLKQLTKSKEILEKLLTTLNQKHQNQEISPIKLAFEFGQLLLRIELYEKDVNSFMEKHSENYECEPLIFRTTKNEEILNHLQQEVFLIQLEGNQNPELNNNKINNDFEKTDSQNLLDEYYLNQIQHSQSSVDITNIPNEKNPDSSFTNQPVSRQNINNKIENNCSIRTPFKANRVQFINKFDGNFRNFNDFFQPFCNNVDKTDLDDATKLQILKSKLDPETRKWLEGYSTDDDYEAAKRTLLRQFNSMFAVKNDVLKKFSELQPPNGDYDLEGYLRLTTSARSAYLNLKRAGADDFTVTILSKQIKGKLSPIRLSILEERIDNEDIQQIIEYLEHVVDKLQDIADPFLANNRTFSRPMASSSRKSRNTCIFCGSNVHITKDCNRVLSYTEKNQLCREAKVCSGCYLPGHTFRYCRNIEHCPQCNGSHKLENCPATRTQQNWRSQINNGSNNEAKKKQTKIKSINSLEANESKLIDLSTPENSDESETEQECFSVKNEKKKKTIPPVLARARINDTKITILLDPGSNINIISKSICENLKLKVYKNNVSIKVTEHRFKSLLACVAKMELGTMERKVIFQLVNDNDMPILLGRDDIHAFKIMLFPGKHELIPMQMSMVEQPEPQEFQKSCYNIEAKTDKLLLKTVKKVIRKMKLSLIKNEQIHNFNQVTWFILKPEID